MTMNASRWIWGTLAGVALGAWYAASPLTIWFVLAVAGVFRWAGVGLGDRERRWVYGILAVAVGIRVAAIVALFLSTQNDQLVSFFWDGDGVYLKYRALVIRQVWMGVPISPVDVFNAFMPYYGWSSFIYVLAYLQYLTGPALYGVHLLNVAIFAASAVAMHRLIRSSLGRASALAGFGLMLFLPTLMAWSVSALKESVCVFLFVVGVRAMITAARFATPMHRRIAALALLVAAIAAADSVRPGISVIMIVGLGAGLAANLVVRRLGWLLIASICLPLAAMQAWDNPRIQSTVMTQLKSAAILHRASYLEKGSGYTLLDRRFYSQYPADEDGRTIVRIDTMTPDEGLRFAARAFASVFVMPLPGQIPPGLSVVLLPQQLIWYILLILACVGVFAGLRRDALVTCMLACLFMAGCLIVALTNGNIGTLVRFRDLVVPCVVWLSALGATSLASSMMLRGARLPVMSAGRDVLSEGH